MTEFFAYIGCINVRQAIRIKKSLFVIHEYISRLTLAGGGSWFIVAISIVDLSTQHCRVHLSRKYWEQNDFAAIVTITFNVTHYALSYIHVFVHFFAAWGEVFHFLHIFHR